MQKSTGYDSTEILERVKASTHLVLEGKAAYERDSVAFPEIRYNWPLAACLLAAGTGNGNKLRVLDFGGSLGSTYFQHLPLLKGLDEAKWNIVEQVHYVKYGMETVARADLRFYYDIDSCFKEERPNVLLLSSVLQYLENPMVVLRELLNFRFPFIIVDRTPFTDSEKDRLMIQSVPSHVYQAKLPCWFFAEKKFLKLFEQDYELQAEFESDASEATGIPGCLKGYMFRLKSLKPGSHS